MFQNPFSFDGRIRRLEYGLSYLIYIILYLSASFLWQEFPTAALFFYPFISVLIWFLLAQGAKRCHDLGNSGFFQFIPFYGLLMLFQDAQSGINKYGRNPKEVAVSMKDSEENALKFPLGKLSIGHSLLRLSSPILINVLLAAMLMEYLNVSDMELFLYISISVIPCHFLALIMNHNSHALEIDGKGQFKERVIYSSTFYVLVRLYTLYFRDTEIYVQAIFFELIIIGLFLCLTYFSFQLYKVIFRKSSLTL
ncbi:DUF805 domain-containing protein [Flagellimonas sediminis]|uniref:DUF805 domain-containing protein n=1 Tax=Flagellimonas sediminis TaxID=2696468 RepID=A0A6I5KNY1_9FLAO|nr:DUF805 domain-containing protein [Allomuricauda sediminis]NDV42396.1 DUF805 domain-containing protein [Allomuricauda sediminis]